MVMQDNQVNLDWNALFSSVFAFLLVVTLFKFSERMLESSDAISHSSYLPQTKRKSWINEIAEKEPFTIYPWLYEKFGGRKLIDASWEERYKTAQRICAQLGLVYNIPCKAQSYGMVEIPIDYFTSNRDYVIDALDEITGVKHKRPWHYQSLLPQVTVEGGEPIPVQYRHLTGWIDEPLPEYSLLTELLPAVEPEVKERKIDAVLKQLKDGVETIQESEKFRLFLTTMAKFHDYSIGNQILIMIQKKDATHVAGFNTWKELGRWVKKGEKGIAILVPVMPPRPACPECGARIPKGARFCQECGVEVERVEIEVTPAYFKVVYVFDISQT